jgi:hypothetical protein
LKLTVYDVEDVPLKSSPQEPTAADLGAPETSPGTLEQSNKMAATPPLADQSQKVMSNDSPSHEGFPNSLISTLTATASVTSEYSIRRKSYSIGFEPLAGAGLAVGAASLMFQMFAGCIQGQCICRELV